MIEKVAWSEWPQFYSDSWTGTATRVLYSGKELFNLVENVEWSDQPIQLEICDYCGAAGCSSNGYASIVRLGDSVIFCEPAAQPETYHIPAQCLKSVGGINIPCTIWDIEMSSLSKVPKSSVFPRALDWQVASYVALTGPIDGIYDLENWKAKVEDQIVFLENMEIEPFLVKTRGFFTECKDSANPFQISEQNHSDELVPVTAYFDSKPEWTGFLRQDDELFFKIGENLIKIGT